MGVTMIAEASIAFIQGRGQVEMSCLPKSFVQQQIEFFGESVSRVVILVFSPFSGIFISDFILIWNFDAFESKIGARCISGEMDLYI
jgi:hypothetical protein